MERHSDFLIFFFADEEMKAFFTKLFLTAFAAISAKLSIQVRNNKVTFWQVVGSYVTGITFSFIFGKYVKGHFSDEWQTVAIAVIAISGDKIGNFLMERIHIDTIMEFLSLFFKPKK